jgi:hypothetical protein
LTLWLFLDRFFNGIAYMEQRKAQRFDLRLPFELVRGGTRTLSERSETMNLSSVGVLFQSDASLKIGEAVEYVITLPTPPDRETPTRIHCLGKVVRFAQKTEVAATLERYEFKR